MESENRQDYLNKLRRLKELKAMKAVQSVQPEAAKATAAPEMSAPQAAIEGFKQSGSLGFADEIGGMIDAGLSKTGDLFVPEGGQNPYADQPIEQTYKSGRDEERAKATQAYEDQPMAALAGGLIGGATTAGVGSLPTRIAVGGISGAGAAKEMDTEGGVDALIGAAIPGVVGGIGSGLRNTTNAMRAAAPAAPGIAAAGSALHGNFMGAGLALAGRSGIERTIEGSANSIDRIIEKAPPQFKKALSDAAAQGSRQLAITHFMLSNQRPDYVTKDEE